MTERAEFRDGERLRAGDLNRESASRRQDVEDHRGLAHPGPGLLGASIISAADDTSISQVPAGPFTTVRVDVPGAPEALRLASRGHRALGPIQGSGASLRTAAALRLVPGAATPASAPWTIRALDIRDDDNRRTGRELRVELRVPPGSSPVSSRVAVHFRPVANPAGPEHAITVDAAGTVTISGDLHVRGTLSEGLIPADRADPRFVAAILGAVAERVLGVATATENPSIKLAVTAGAASDADRTIVEISSNVDRPFPLWGVAMEIERQGRRTVRMVRVGGEPTQKVPITASPVVPWPVRLTPGTAATITVAVVAFDAPGDLFAQRASITVPPPPELDDDGDLDEGLEIPV
ncbi:hypothetical protein AB0C07_37080 [Actinoplanes missouriensis]|uniref:hypothetical protein n=1 Tax=Actinoplanes missouriensis TaxID=1866 RepID=UPI0033F41C67